MIRRPPRSTRTDTLVPYTTLFRSVRVAEFEGFSGFWLDLGKPRFGPSAVAAQDVQSVIVNQREVSRVAALHALNPARSEEHTSELQSLMRISYAVFCLKKKKTTPITTTHNQASKT